MDFRVLWVDNIQQYVDSRQQPQVLLDKTILNDQAMLGVCYVPRSPLLADPVKWNHTKKGDVVIVPLVGYEIPSPHQSAILAAGLEYGMRAMSSLALQIESPPIEVILVVASDVFQLENGWQCFLGMAVRTA